MKFILMFVCAVAILIAFPYIFGISCDGEKEWNTYSGELSGLYIEVDTCCHCDTRIKFYNQSWIYLYDCDESLYDLLTINETYTVHTCPYQEPYAVTRGMWERGCIYVEVIDYIENDHGDVIYGSKWW